MTHDGFALVVPLPRFLAEQFPSDEGDPHVTICYFKPENPRDVALAGAIVGRVSWLIGAFDVNVTGGIHYFEPSDSSEGRRVAAAAVQSEGAVDLRNRFLDELARFRVQAPQSHPGYVPHVTLAYLDPAQTYDGPIPSGRFVADSVEIWFGGGRESYVLDPPGFGIAM